jgi:hypothetical protein
MCDYKKKATNGQVNDGGAPNADERLSAREKFQGKSFIPTIDALEINWKKRAIM